MNKLLATAVASAAMVFSTGHAQAEQTGYIGLNYAPYELSDGSTDLTLPVVYATLGGQVHENIAVEVRAGLAAGEDTAYVFGTPVDVELSQLVGANIRLGAPVTETIYPYVMLGYNRVELEASAFGSSFDETESDVAYGLGARFMVAERISITAEYALIYDKDGEEIDGFSVGIANHF